MCDGFNIQVDTASDDSVKFLNFLESCNITQHVHTPLHLHGHILDLILAVPESTVISNICVGGYISDHAVVYGRLELISPFVPKSYTVTIRRYHKIKMQHLRCDFANWSFITCPGNTVSVLYE